MLLAMGRSAWSKAADQVLVTPVMTDSLPDPADTPERILVLDFGSQVTQLIARRLRESGVYCEIWPFNADPARIEACTAWRSSCPAARRSVHRRRVAAGAADGVRTGRARSWASATANSCMCAATRRRRRSRRSSRIRPSLRRCERMIAHCSTACGSKGAREQVWMSHGDRVTRLPPGFRVVGTQRGRAVRRVRRRRAPVLRRCSFTPRSCTRPHGAAVAAQFHPSGRGPVGIMDHGRVPRDGDRPYPRTGGQRRG